MRKWTIMMTMATIVAMVAGCGSKTERTAPAERTTRSVELPDSDKHSAEYITQRIDTIYSLCNDSLCCSESYLALCAEADKLTKEYGLIAIDADHWVQGQDEDKEWSYQLMSVSDITDSTATVTVNIHNFTDQQVVLDLRFERDDWYVDNFRTYFEDMDYDDDGNPLPDTEGMKVYDERKEIRHFIDDILAKRKAAAMN